MDPDPKESPKINKPVMALVLLVVLLPVLFWLSRLSPKQDANDRLSVRTRGAEACAALGMESAGIPEVSAAADAFEADKQLVLSVAARQAESRLQGGTETDATISDLAKDCDATYDNGL